MSYLDPTLNDLAELAEAMEEGVARQLTAVNNIRRMLHKLRLCEGCGHPIPWHPVTTSKDATCHAGQEVVPSLCLCAVSQEELLLLVVKE